MPKIKSENSEMSSVEFVHDALREWVAPPTIGSKKERLRYATAAVFEHERKTKDRKRKRSWTVNRVRDFWNGDPRVSPNGDEIRDLEEMTGLRYGREELRSLEQLISKADTFLDGSEADFYRPFVDAFRAMARAFDRAGTEG